MLSGGLCCPADSWAFSHKGRERAQHYQQHWPGLTLHINQLYYPLYKPAACLTPWPVLEGTSTCWQLPSTDPGRDRQLGEKSRQPRGSPRPYFYNGQYACQFPRPPCDLCTPTTAPGVPSLTAAAFASGSSPALLALLHFLLTRIHCAKLFPPQLQPPAPP